MITGQEIEVQLAGDPDSWYRGTVIKSRKQWVSLSNYGRPMIADESNIVAWRMLHVERVSTATKESE